MGSLAYAEQTNDDKISTGSLVITSDSLHADGKEGTATFIGGVKAIGEDIHLTADRMKVFYSDGGALLKIDAEGSVKLIKDGKVVTSDHATYSAEDRTLIFTGNARAVDEGNVLVGTKITYMIDDQRYKVEGSKVFIESSGLMPLDKPVGSDEKDK